LKHIKTEKQLQALAIHVKNYGPGAASFLCISPKVLSNRDMNDEMSSSVVPIAQATCIMNDNGARTSLRA